MRSTGLILGLGLVAGLATTAHAAAPADFARCQVCHQVSKGGPNGLGPNLYGVVGKKAGVNAKGFNYSAALKGSGLVWNEATLDKWIENPRQLVAGTMMAFPGLKDPAKRKAIIDWLATQK